MLTPGQNPENGVICPKTLTILLRGGTGARQGISQLIQHQYRLDLVSARADRVGRTGNLRAGGCGRFGVGGGLPPETLPGLKRGPSGVVVRWKGVVPFAKAIGFEFRAADTYPSLRGGLTAPTLARGACMHP